MKRSILVCAALALAVSACEQKPKPEETTSTTGAASPAEPVANDKAGTPIPDPAAQAATAAAAAADNEDIPTEADFEEEAEQKITAANFEQELTTLEKEIGK
ncbi:MAG TPA: hypothetical protein VI072_02495 [Polyangiaceae bacterium]